MQKLVTGIIAMALAGYSAGQCAEPQEALKELADDYLESVSIYYPGRFVFMGQPFPEEAVFNINKPSEVSAWNSAQRAILNALDEIDTDNLGPGDQITYANLRELMEADLGQNICRQELWALDYYTGWQALLPTYFFAYAEARKGRLDASQLDLWAEIFVQYLQQEKHNLQEGLTLGYTAPASLARRVALQVDALASENTAALASAVDALETDSLSAHWKGLRRTMITPALIEFAAYLRADYAANTRTEHSLSLNKDGVACYAAKLRYYSSVEVDPQAFLSEQQEEASRITARFLELGSKIYNVESGSAITQALRSDRTADYQGTDDEIMKAAQDLADRLIEDSRPYFPDLFEHSVQVLPYDDASLASGAARASYAGPIDEGLTGRYFLNPRSEDARSSFQLAVTTVHEVAPGHHMQTMVSLNRNLELGDLHPVNGLSFIGGYVEGWADYAERLAMEEGLFADPRSELVEMSSAERRHYSEILLHLGGSDDQYRSFFVDDIKHGRLTEEDVDGYLDRLAMWPGQNSSYELGGAAIYHTREKAKAELGECFSLPEFHRIVLENGSVPLWFVSERVSAWTAKGCDSQSAG